MQEKKICIWKHFFPKIFWLFKSINKQQHPTHESSAVCQTHEEEKQHGDERRMDGPLHQQGHTGKIHSKKFSLVLRALIRGTADALSRLWDVWVTRSKPQCRQGTGLGQYVHSLWVSQVVEQTTELEKSVDSNLRETNSFPSITWDDFPTTWMSCLPFYRLAFRTLLCDSGFFFKALHFRERRNNDNYYILLKSLGVHLKADLFRNTGILYFIR